jgi:hypothetical protein
MNTHSLIRRFCHSSMCQFAAITLLVLSYRSFVFYGEIHEAAKAGDLPKVKAMLKDDPALVSSKEDRFGCTPLHEAASAQRRTQRCGGITPRQPRRHQCQIE